MKQISKGCNKQLDVFYLREKSSERSIPEGTTLLNMSKYYDGKAAEMICNLTSVQCRKRKETYISRSWIKGKSITRRTLGKEKGVTR